MEESASLVASSVGSRSRPTSLKSRTLSARSWGSVAGSAHSDINGSLHIIPPSIGIPDEETYLGRDVMEVIMRLRSRRNMSTDLEAIAEGLDPDWGLNNLQNLYIKEEDGKFLYCLPKNRKERAARYNPYDLVCVSSKEAQACSQYFTVTSSAITQVRIILGCFNSSGRMVGGVEGILWIDVPMASLSRRVMIIYCSPEWVCSQETITMADCW